VIDGGVEGVVAYLDGEIAGLHGNGPGALLTSGVIAMLQEIREGLVERPDWSEVMEGNLRAELAAARLEHTHYQEQCEIAGGIFQAALNAERERTERARRTAVRLESELARLEAPYTSDEPIRDLLARSDAFPNDSGSVGFGFTRDELIALLRACTPRLSSISVIPSHDAFHDMTSFEITIYTSFARSELLEESA
jgi:hypothetical protein